MRKGILTCWLKHMCLSVLSNKIKLNWSRYHYVLKTHWLDGKWNCHIDYVIYMLVLYMDPYYQSWHTWQSIGLEGLDLAEMQHCEITASARHVLEDSILQFDMTQFHVASQSNPGIYYAINLHQKTCDCTDFPQACFCKHIATTYIHFPYLFASNPCSIVPQNAIQILDKPQYASTSLLEENV